MCLKCAFSFFFFTLIFLDSCCQDYWHLTVTWFWVHYFAWNGQDIPQALCWSLLPSSMPVHSIYSFFNTSSLSEFYTFTWVSACWFVSWHSKWLLIQIYSSSFSREFWILTKISKWGDPQISKRNGAVRMQSRFGVKKDHLTLTCEGRYQRCREEVEIWFAFFLLSCRSVEFSVKVWGFGGVGPWEIWVWLCWWT